MTIREIHANDKSQWLALWSDYLSYYKVDLDDHVTHGVWQRLMDAADPLKGFVCVNNDRVIGFTHYFFHGTTWNSTSYCYLEDLFVDQTVRSKGAGRALISAVRDAATKQGAAKLYWHTDSENETAQALYNKVAERTGFIRYDVTL